jgi:signal transduction histidine kinase
LIQLASEAILNAYRHAQARRIDVKLTYHPSRLSVSIRDDGIGIATDVISLGGRRGHFGLAGMRERAEKIKGDFNLSSRAGWGTKIEVSVPAMIAYVKQPAFRSRILRLMPITR